MTSLKIYFPVLALSIMVPLLAQWHPEPHSKRIQFSGYEWIVKDSGGRRVGPGSNYFSEDAVRVDADGLKLRIFEKAGRFYCAEVVSTVSFGYGTYRFHVASNVDRLAPNVTLGLFTWQDDPGEEGSHKELDAELGRWGNPGADVAQYVLQPYSRPGNVFRFPLPADAPSSMHSFTWSPQKVHFMSMAGGSVVADHTFTHRVPVPDKENARINLWITSGRIPDQGSLEVTISAFEFLAAKR